MGPLWSWGRGGHGGHGREEREGREGASKRRNRGLCMRSSLSLQSEQSTLSQTEACCNRLRAQAPQGSATLCHPLPLRFCNRHFLSSRHSSSRSLARSALLARRPAITMSASDPFYLVKEEIQDSVTKLHTTLARWEKLPVSSTERSMLSREIVSTCESISWQVDELDKATGVAERDPARFSVDPAEIDRRKKWTSSTRNQVHSITEKVQSTPTRNVGTGAGLTNRRELMRLDDSFQQTPVRTDHDSYISNESDRQELLLREQDDDLDELSVSLGHVGHVGLVIHEELSLQGGFMDKLSDGMDGTATRLDLVQKKLTTVMKKAGWKGQVLMIVFLVVLLLILTFLVFSA